MAGEWNVTSLDELYEFSSGLSKPRSAFGAGYPFLSFRDVFYNIFVPQRLTELVQSTEQERERCSVRRGDVFLTRTSETMDELGMSSVALRDIPDATFNGFTKRLRPKYDRKIVPEYAGYYFRSPDFRQAVTAMSSMSTRASLNNEMLARLSIVLPSFNEQTAIGHVLGTLDDKFALNRRMNETLEAMTRALFKSWFVDFDPVRARAEGRDPGLPKPLADLFPDSFEYSEMGEIPKGWGVRPLRDLSAYLSRGVGPVYVESGGICVLNQKCVRDHRIDFSKARRHDSVKKSVDGRMLRPLDILVNSTGVGTLGRVGQLWTLPERAIVDSHLTVIRSAADVDPWFLGQAVMCREADIESLGEGSTGQTELSRARLGELTILVPPLELQTSFGRVVEPLLLRVSENERANATVAALRDALLPKLVSGEVRIEHDDTSVNDTGS